jgi:hypothetical protein
MMATRSRMTQRSSSVPVSMLISVVISLPMRGAFRVNIVGFNR